MESANTTQKKVELIEASKKYPPFNRGWKNFRNLKRPASMEWAENFQQATVMFQYVLSSISVMRSSTPLLPTKRVASFSQRESLCLTFACALLSTEEQSEEKKERTRTLYAQLNKSVELERGLKNAMQSNHRPSMQVESPHHPTSPLN